MARVIPAEMTEIVITEPGGPEVLQPRQRTVPEPASGEILVRVKAAGVNRPDIMQRQGTYPMPAGVNPTPGLEIAGEVVALGEGVVGHRIGDEVCALTNGGGYAQYCVVPASQALPLPKGLTALQAAAIPETFFTVWANLFSMGGLRSGESVLIHGGTSGIGSTALMLCKALGIRAYATVGGSEKASFVESLGGIPIDYHTEQFDEAIRNLTGRSGVDVVFDIVGGKYFNRNLDALKAKDGRLIIIGFMGGAHARDADLMKLVLKRATVTGSTMRSRTIAEKGQLAQELQKNVWPLFEDGACPPPHICKVFDLNDAAEAHREMEEGRHTGKIVLKVSDD